MAFVVANRVKETSTTSGTGALNLSGAVDGFQTFVEGVGTTNTTYYAIYEPSSDGWEVGIGTVTSGTPDTLSRDTVFESSNSGNLVNFGSTAKDVICTQPAESLSRLDNNLDTNGNDIKFGDNDKATFGAGDDLEIYHDGSNSYVSDQGTGNLKVLASTVQIMNALGDENALVVRQNAEVELYHNGLEKLATTSTGIDVTGKLYISDIGYQGAADQPIRGVVYPYRETLSRSVGDGVQWVQIYDPVDAGQPREVYLRVQHSGDNTSCVFDAHISFAGYGFVDHIVVTNHQKYNNPKVTEIRTHQNATNDMEVWVRVEDLSTYNGTLTVLSSDGIPTLTATSTEPTWLNSEVIYTNINSTNKDMIFSNGILHQDGVKAAFGTDIDMEVWHQGTYGLVQNYTGTLIVQTDDTDSDVIIKSDDGSGGVTDYFRADGSTGEAILYHYGSEKLATKSTGVDVTGTVTADGLTVDGTNQIQFSNGKTAYVTGHPSPSIYRTGTSSGSEPFNLFGNLVLQSRSNAATGVYVVTGITPANRLKIEDTGDISFYDDSGTSQDFYWDASTSRLGLGTTSPEAPLEVAYTTSAPSLEESDAGFLLSANNTLRTMFGADPSSPYAHWIQVTNSSGSGTFPLSLNPQGGNVGIGTTSPSKNLSVFDNTGDCNISVQTGLSGSGATQILFGDAEANNSGRVYYNNSDDSMRLYTAGSEAARIDSSGRVGIGTTSPEEPLTVQSGLYTGTVRIGADVNAGTLTDATQKLARINAPHYTNAEEDMFVIGTSCSSNANILYLGGSSGNHNAATSIQFYTAANHTTTSGSEAARIDSSGNLLVGKTAVAQNNEGVELRSTGLAIFTKADSNAIKINRTGTDGDLAIFSKGGNNVGSIGTTLDDLYIHSTATDHRGLRFGQGFVSPITATATTSDGDCDLGESSARFKDLYLSGDVISDGSVTSNVDINAQTGTTYTTVLADRSKLVTLDNASAVTVTIPPNSSVAYPTGTKIDLLAKGAGQVTVAAGTGVTVNSSQTLKLRAQWSAASVIKLATDTWVLVGDLEAS